MTAALLAHGPGLDNGFTNWDDPGYLLHNPFTTDPLHGGARELLLTPNLHYPIPVTVLAYAGQRAVFGLDAAAFHAVSLGLHLFCVMLAAILARRLGASWLAAAVAATIFAVHPVTVEPVAWVVGQKDLLATLFALAALAIRAGPPGASATPETPGRDDANLAARHGWPATLAVVTLTVLAMASKPSAVCTPVLLIGVDLFRAHRAGRWPGVSWRPLALHGALLLLALGQILLSLHGHDGAPVARFGRQSLAEAAWGLGLEFRHLLWPHPLLARYFAPTGAALVTGVILGLTVLVAVTGGWLLALRRGRRAVALAIAGALVAYAPVSGLLPLTRGPADSYLYLPLGLLVIAIASGLDRPLVARRLATSGSSPDSSPDPSPGLSSRQWPRLLAMMIIAVLVIAAIAASRAQTRTWRDAGSLWFAVASHHPDDPRALMRLGDAMLFTARPDRAVAIYARIDQQFPDFITHAISHGDALETLGRHHEAEAVLARGAERGDLPVFAERYGFFLVAHGDIAPSRPDVARRAIVQIAPLLAERGKRPTSLRRTIELLDGFGDREWAARIRQRLQVIESRRTDDRP